MGWRGGGWRRQEHLRRGVTRKSGRITSGVGRRRYSVWAGIEVVGEGESGEEWGLERRLGFYIFSFL